MWKFWGRRLIGSSPQGCLEARFAPPNSARGAKAGLPNFQIGTFVQNEDFPRGPRASVSVLRVLSVELARPRLWSVLPKAVVCLSRLPLVSRIMLFVPLGGGA